VHADNIAVDRARKLDRPSVEVSAHGDLPGSKANPRIRNVETLGRTKQVRCHRVKSDLDLSGGKHTQPQMLWIVETVASRGKPLAQDGVGRPGYNSRRGSREGHLGVEQGLNRASGALVPAIAQSVCE
jgi:hypothetical protein